MRNKVLVARVCVCFGAMSLIAGCSSGSSRSTSNPTDSGTTSTVYVTALPNKQDVGPRGGLVDMSSIASSPYQVIAVDGIVTSWRIDTKIDKSPKDALNRAKQTFSDRCFQAYEKTLPSTFSGAIYDDLKKYGGYLKVTGQTDPQVVPDPSSSNQAYDGVDLSISLVKNDGSVQKYPTKRYLFSMTRDNSNSMWKIDGISEPKAS